jgi:hypothetical protein
VKNYYGTQYEAWALNGLEEPLEKKKPQDVACACPTIGHVWDANADKDFTALSLSRPCSTD